MLGQVSSRKNLVNSGKVRFINLVQVRPSLVRFVQVRSGKVCLVQVR
jgi:hypothetical protein